MNKLKNGLVAIALITGTVFMFNANVSRGQIISEPDAGQVVCKCKSGFLGRKCKADGSDGNQCNASDKCWESNRNC